MQEETLVSQEEKALINYLARYEGDNRLLEKIQEQHGKARESLKEQEMRPIDVVALMRRHDPYNKDRFQHVDSLNAAMERLRDGIELDAIHESAISEWCIAASAYYQQHPDHRVPNAGEALPAEKKSPELAESRNPLKPWQYGLIAVGVVIGLAVLATGIGAAVLLATGAAAGLGAALSIIGTWAAGLLPGALTVGQVFGVLAGAVGVLAAGIGLLTGGFSRWRQARQLAAQQSLDVIHDSAFESDFPGPNDPALLAEFASLNSTSQQLSRVTDPDGSEVQEGTRQQQTEEPAMEDKGVFEPVLPSAPPESEMNVADAVLRDQVNQFIQQHTSAEAPEADLNIKAYEASKAEGKEQALVNALKDSDSDILKILSGEKVGGHVVQRGLDNLNRICGSVVEGLTASEDQSPSGDGPGK